MNAEQVMTELKKYRLATFGTAHERKERLRKHHGKFTSCFYRKAYAVDF